MLTRALGRRRTRLVAAAVLAAAVAASVLVSTRSSATPDLPQIGPRALVASVLRASAGHIPVHGTATTHVDVGLPQLPSSDVGAPATGPLAALTDLTGDHTLRVWASEDGFRVAELLPAAERAVFATKNSLWLWNSDTLTASRVVLPSGPPASSEGTRPATNLTPGGLAAKALRAIRPTTEVSVEQPTMVAGRPAYTLVLRPRTAQTLVGEIELDVDSATRVPLRAALFARGSTSPAISAGYRSVSFDPIDPSTFQFTPPPGAKVRTITPTESHDRTQAGTFAGARPVTRTFGRGWAEVLAVRVPSSLLMRNRQFDEYAKFLPYSGPLVSARLLDQGRYEWLLAGLVPQARLEAVAARLP